MDLESKRVSLEVVVQVLPLFLRRIGCDFGRSFGFLLSVFRWLGSVVAGWFFGVSFAGVLCFC